MDKQEYKLKAEEIKNLIGKREFFEAVKIADEIDWRRVRSVTMLCTVSDLYKVNRRYKESKELLLMAYERNPRGRKIVYSLCELCLKMGDLVQAIEFEKEFERLAPDDSGVYVLRYKLYVTQNVRLEERIAVLEALKRKEPREKWLYELAYLYHRMGLFTKCVEECDELILWFREGRYVKKAMELKMLHQPLTPAQEASYNSFVGKAALLPKVEPAEEKPIEDQIEVRPVNIGQYNTMDLQKALAESLEGMLGPVVSDPVNVKEPPAEEMSSQEQDLENEKEVFFEDATGEMPPAEAVQPVMEEVWQAPEEVYQAPEMTEVQETAVPVMAEAGTIFEEEPEPEAAETVQAEEKKAEEIAEEDGKEENAPEAKKIEMSARGVYFEVPQDATKEFPSVREIMRRSLTEISRTEPVEEEKTPSVSDDIPANMADMLSQEYDGQISLVVQEQAETVKQITGQMNIEEVLIEWEKTKKEYEKKRTEERKQKVLEQTGSMFTEFEARVRDGILEKLQKEEDLQQDDGEEISAGEESHVMSGEDTDKAAEEEDIKETIPEAQTEGAEEVFREEGSEEEVLFLKEENLEEEAVFLKEEVQEKEQLQNREILRQKMEERKEEKAEDKEEKEEKLRTPEDTEMEETMRKVRQAQEEMREFSEEEKSLFAPFIHTKGARRRLMKAMDSISLAAYTGNVIVTGEGDSDTLKLARNVMKDIQMTDSNFSGVIAKVSGSSLNSKGIEHTIAKLNNGGLIIEKASGMNSQAVFKLLKALNQEKTGIVVILEDNKKAMKRLLAAYPSISSFFDVRIEVEELNNGTLAAYGRQYAAHMEYAIDDLGMLALETLIENRQTSEHIVTASEVREMVDDAIDNANRKTLGCFWDIIFGRRYNEEDMIILREKDFY